MSNWPRTGPNPGTKSAHTHHAPEVGIARHADGGGYLYMKNELLVAEEDYDDVVRLLTDAGEELAYPPPRDTVAPGWYRLILAAPDSTPIPRLVTRIRGEERGGTHKPSYRVSPNHVMYGNQHPGWPGTGSPPRAATEALKPLPPISPDVEPAARVVVLDSGELFKHHWIDSSRVQKLLPNGELSTDHDAQPQWEDELPKYAGHSTFLTGVVLQHAPWTSVRAAQALNDDGWVSDTDLAAAIANLEKVKTDIDILHLSAAGMTHDNMGLPATREALASLWDWKPGIQVVAPAGNGAVDIPWFPAAFKGVIAVAATTPERSKAWFSNYGDWVDACADGVDVKSTYLVGSVMVQPTHVPAGESEPEWWAETQAFDEWAYWSGTCFAAARVTGAIAETMRIAGVNAAEAAFRLVGRGQRRHRDSQGHDLGVPVYPASWG